MVAAELPKRANALGVHYDRLGAPAVMVRDVFVVGIDRHRLVAAATPRRIVGGQDSLERLSELGVENGVDDRVEGRVGVPQPCQDLERYVGDAGFAEGCHYVDAEERDLNTHASGTRLMTLR